MEYTPGPWTVSDEWHGDVYIDSDEQEEGSIALAKLVNPKPGDAALISAAPDFYLEAIETRNWLVGLRHCEFLPENWQEIINDRINGLNRAISKAEGTE